MFGDVDEPLIEVSVAPKSPGEGGRQIALDSDQRTALSALLAQAPAVIQSGYLALTPTFRLTFAPGIASKMTKLMQAQGGGLRATALNQHGKIMGNGVLHPANGLRAIAAAAVVWQALAIITAQVHLSEINARLAAIERGVGDIRAWLEAEQVSTIETGLRYVREATAALERGDLSEAERDRMADQLAHVWRDCGQVARTLLAMMERASITLETHNLTAWYQLSGSSARVLHETTDYERRAQAYLGAVYVRCIIVGLRAALECNPGISQQRLDELRDDLANWRDTIKVFFGTLSRCVSSKLSARLNRQATIATERRRALAHAREAKRRLNEFGESIEQASNRVRVRVEAQQASTTTGMTTLDERGQIAEVYQAAITAQEPVSTMM